MAFDSQLRPVILLQLAKVSGAETIVFKPKSPKTIHAISRTGKDELTIATPRDFVQWHLVRHDDLLNRRNRCIFQVDFAKMDCFMVAATVHAAAGAPFKSHQESSIRAAAEDLFSVAWFPSRY